MTNSEVKPLANCRFGGVLQGRAVYGIRALEELRQPEPQAADSGQQYQRLVDPDSPSNLSSRLAEVP